MQLKWLLYLGLITTIEAKNQDPFHQPPPAVVKVHQVLKKYRYHGFVKVNKNIFAIIKMVGADYELINLGMHKGLGQVIVIDASRICIRKSGKSYCLTRSDTAKAWEAIHV